MAFQRKGSPEPITGIVQHIVDDAKPFVCTGCGAILGIVSHGVLKTEASTRILNNSQKVHKCNNCNKENPSNV